MAMARHVVAEQHDDVGIERVGARHDRGDVVERHPGIAGVKVGDGRDLQFEAGGPAARREVISRHAQPQQRLDAETVGRRRGAERAETGRESQELCDVKA